MKKFTNYFVMLLVALTTTFGLSSCDKDPDAAPEVFNPSISSAVVDEATITETSASFNVKFAEVEKIFYSCYQSDASAEDWKSVDVSADESTVKVEFTSLTAGTSYVADFYAVNGDAKSEVKSVEFSTSETPVVLPTIEVACTTEEGTVGSASFEVTVANATTYSYAYYPTESAPAEDAIEWITFNVAEDGTTELTVDAEAGEYTLVAFASRDEVKSEVASIEFSVAAPAEVIAISNIKVGDLMISMDVTIDKSQCDGFAYFSGQTEYFDMSYFTGEVYGGYGKYVEESSTVVFGSDYYLTPNSSYTLCFAAYKKDATGAYTIVGGEEKIISAPYKTGKGKVGTSNTSAQIEVKDELTSLTQISGVVYRNDEIAGFAQGYVTAEEADAAGGINEWIASTAWMETKAYCQSFGMYDWATEQIVPRDEVEFTVGSLASSTEYYVFAVAIDLEGNVGNITSVKTSTQGLVVDPTVMPLITCTPHESTADFTIDFNGCAKVLKTNHRVADTYNNEETIYNNFINDLGTLYYGWASDNEAVVDGKVSWTETYLGMDEEYEMYYIGVSADGALGEIQKIEYKTIVPTYDSAATLNITPAVCQAYYKEEYPQYPYAELSYNVELADGAVAYKWGSFDKEYVMNQNSEEAFGDYLIGVYANTVTSSEALTQTITIYSQNNVIVFVPVDADGKYGIPQVLTFDGWEDAIVDDRETGSGDGGGAEPLNN